jgi:hypothetical protein
VIVALAKMRAGEEECREEVHKRKELCHEILYRIDPTATVVPQIQLNGQVTNQANAQNHSNDAAGTEKLEK